MKPSIIQPHHLARLAVFYGRQSTPEQVEFNTGSTEYQRRQVQYARDWGWPEDRIRWFDDFGMTGAAAEHRPQYREMRRLLRAGDVALVGIADISRLGRDAVELLSLVQDCIDHRAVIAVDGRIIDPRESSEWLLTGVRALLSQHGARTIRETVERGLMGKLEAGKAVTHPPVGYEKGPDGEWSVTSDPRVRAAISAVFRVYIQVRSLRAAVTRLLELHAKIPVRRVGGALQFLEPNISRVYQILRNPNYTPDYYYRRRVIDLSKPRTTRGHHRLRKSMPDEVVVTKNHHEGYITREQRAEILAIFGTNAWSGDHASIGHGHAITQGLARCSKHRGWVLRVHYKRGPQSGPASHGYYCEGDYKTGGNACRTVPGCRLDDAVLRAVLQRLSPPSLFAVQEALKRILADSRAEQRHQDLEAARLRQRVSELERKLDALDPDSFQVFKHIERQLEGAKRSLITIEGTDDVKRREMAREHASILAEAVQLAPDVQRIVGASTTTNRDRKELVRILVRTVFIDEWGSEKLGVRVCWNDETPDTRIDVWLRAGVERLIMDLHGQGQSFDDIAVSLNDLEIGRDQGKVWGRRSVYDFVRERLRRRRTRRRRRQSNPADPGRARL